MKIDLASIDRDEFIVRPHVIAGEICYLVFPKSIATKYTKQTLIYRSSVWNAQGEPVSLSFKKFFNWGEQPDLAYTPFSLTANGGVELMEKIDGCLNYNTKLNLWNGGTISIGEIVNKNLLGLEVVGMDKNGNLVPNKVISVFNNGKKDNWLKIETDAYISPRNSRKGNGRGGNQLIITENHKVFVNNQWISAKELKINDSLVSYRYKCCENTSHLIRSCLLGDGSLIFDYFSFSQMDEKSEYIEYIRNLLGESFSSVRNIVSGFGTKMLQLSSIRHESFKQFRDEWYQDGKKILPNNLDWIDDFSVAIWYMDDGSLSHSEKQNDRAHFSTHCFSYEENLRLAKKLNELYDIDCQVQSSSKGYFLRINSGKNNEINNFWERVSKYILPCFKYKLPIHWRKNDSLIKKERGKFEKYKVESKVLNIEFRQPFSKTGYDIETDTHNFFAKGVLVHNSALITSKYKGQHIIRTRGTVDASDMENGFEIETLKAKYPLAFEWPDGVETGLYTRIFEWVSPYNRIVLDYGLEPDIYLIGAVKHEDYSLVSQKELDEWATQMYVKRPKRFNFASIQEMLDGVFALKGEEGLCCYCNKGQDIRKVKSAWYLALHKMKSELGSFEHLVDLYFAMGTPTYEEFAAHIKENFDYEVGESIRGDISRIAGGMKEVRELTAAMEEKVSTLRSLARKDAAAIILQAYGNTNRSGMAFKRLDNKELVQDDIKKLLYQVLKK